MTSALVVETSVNVTPNSLSQDYSHPDHHNLRTYDMTPGFKPCTVFISHILAFAYFNLEASPRHVKVPGKTLTAVVTKRGYLETKRDHKSSAYFSTNIVAKL